MHTFCTIFDKNYLYQGVALYNSLKRYAGDFKLYALCMDSRAYTMLTKMEFESLVPISVEELINPEISEVRDRTTHGQFCWLCQPFVCQFVLDKFDVDMVTYLEADSLFFSDPKVLFDEMGEKSVAIVSHNYSPEFDNTSVAGRFCTQFNAFRNNSAAREMLSYWKVWCLKYNKSAPLAYPGQTCLNVWPEFDCVKVIQHPGAGVAPWNIQKFKFEMIDSAPYVDGIPIVFFHYHEYGRYEDGSCELGNYPLDNQVIGSLYRTYVGELEEVEIAVRKIDPTFTHRRLYSDRKTLGELLKSASKQDVYRYIKVLRRKIRGTYNVYPKEHFLKNW